MTRQSDASMSDSRFCAEAEDAAIADRLDGVVRPLVDDSVEPVGLGELTYLERGSRLAAGEVHVLRDAVVSLTKMRRPWRGSRSMPTAVQSFQRTVLVSY